VLLRRLLVLLYSQFGDLKLIIINSLRLNWNIRHGAIVDNVVACVYAKCGDDRL